MKRMVVTTTTTMPGCPPKVVANLHEAEREMKVATEAIESSTSAEARNAALSALKNADKKEKEANVRLKVAKAIRAAKAAKTPRAREEAMKVLRKTREDVTKSLGKNEEFKLGRNVENETAYNHPIGMLP